MLRAQLQPPDGGRWPIPRQIGYQSFSYEQPADGADDDADGEDGDSAPRPTHAQLRRRAAILRTPPEQLAPQDKK